MDHRFNLKRGKRNLLALKKYERKQNRDLRWLGRDTAVILFQKFNTEAEAQCSLEAMGAEYKNHAQKNLVILENRLEGYFTRCSLLP